MVRKLKTQQAVEDAGEWLSLETKTFAVSACQSASGATFPALVGYLSTSMPLGEVIGMLAAGGYLLVIVACLPLPETRGRDLALQG